MNMRSLLFFLLLLTSGVGLFGQAKLKSPEEFLGYRLGDRFTRHHRVLDYYRHVDEAMPNVSVIEYGETYEHRPLVYAIVTSPDNFQRLEQIRQDNLRRTGMLEGAATTRKAVVWLSFNVHGNEANSMEASMQTLFELADPSNAKSQEWLKSTVVILDPCINPDGRDRYANFYNQYGNMPASAEGDAKEHHEPWPGGRANHYLFDLNRDWAWQTQVETQQRLKAYNQWMPHVHVDFHEQGYNSPYYFAPAAEPYHEVITPWQREFQTMIGKNHAKYFDQEGWLYFTKEVFDLYYPSYGDTYPTYSGAIGMTYEQAGGGYGGLTITTEEGDPLTLKDRLTHHHTTGLSTVEITAQNADRVIDEFEKYFRENNNAPTATYKTYIVKGSNNPDKLRQLSVWLDAHGIRHGHPAAAKTGKGFDFSAQAQATYSMSTDDIVINVFQPKSRFITTVFEPQSKLPDSLTYDITAWNLMYAYNLKGYATTDRINPATAFRPVAVEVKVRDRPYAYIFRYETLKDVELLAALMKKGVRVRASEIDFSIGTENFAPGTLLVTRRNNESLDDFDRVVQSAAKELNRKVYTSTTGFVDKGKDMGSSAVRYLKPPKVAVLFGEQTSSLNAGEIWHFFEQQIHYPITQIGTDYFGNVDLDKYNVLVVPEGYYRLFDEPALERVSNWVSSGGRLIVLANALNAFSEKKGFGLKPFRDDEEKSEAEKKDKESRERQALSRYNETERKQISDYISGAIYKITLDKSHPLAFGMGNTYYTLKTNELRFAFLEDGWNVGVIEGSARPVQGFAGYRANQKLNNSLVFGVEQKGQGKVVYMVDNPLFRSFWENGKMLFSNAVFMVQ